jgi:hypothetical protein
MNQEETSMNTKTTGTRSGVRIRQEGIVGVKTSAGMSMAYTIDLSRGGVKLGRPQLSMPVGETVELVLEKRGEKFPFSGHVARNDGNHFIDRIHQSGNAYFVKIEDARYANFVNENYFI